MWHFKLILICLLLFPFFGMAQKVVVSGVVKDQTSKKPLAFVHVVSKQGYGTTTDIDGKFSLRIKKNECCLKMTYVGYETTSYEID